MHSQNRIVDTTGLCKSLGGMAVLNGVDLALCAGECVALVGDNGAGKTTLLRCLAAECRPTQGAIRWFGDDYRGPNLKKQIGFVAHEGRLCPQLTARENLIFAARMCRADHAGQRADAWLESTGLSVHAHRKPGELSRGMRQRLAVACALVHDPELLLLDEPFVGLDTQAQDWLCQLVRELSEQGRTIVFSTHDASRVAELAKSVLLLKQGRLHSAADVASPELTSVPYCLRAA